MKAYEEGKEPAKRKGAGPELKAHLGMPTTFGSLVGDKEQTVLGHIGLGPVWAFPYVVISIYCVPSLVPDNEIRGNSGRSLSSLSPCAAGRKGMGPLNSLSLESMVALQAMGCVSGWGRLLLSGHRLTQDSIALGGRG